MAVTNQRNDPSVIVDPDRTSYNNGKEKRTAGSGDNGCDVKVKFTRSISTASFSSGTSLRSQSSEDFDVEAKAKAYFDKRVMTPMQEQFNAITMVPGMIYSIYFCWMLSAYQRGGVDIDGCFGNRAYPFLAALAPLPVMSAAFGTLVHSSFSVLYHWKCSTSIEPSKRITHWSRRLDHASIHFASAFASYGTSGRVDYFLLNLAFNFDCGLRQIEERIQPRRNLTRIAMSISFYVLPVLLHGEYMLVFQFAAMFGVGGWLFVRYPFGGWSHSLFHMVLTVMPHLVMTAALRLESSQLHLDLAAKCSGNTEVGLF